MLEIVLLSLLSPYIYSSINRATAHPNPHTLPAARCPLTTKQQDRYSELSGHRDKRNCSRYEATHRHITATPLHIRLDFVHPTLGYLM